jgi:hypothetical protein
MESVPVKKKESKALHEQMKGIQLQMGQAMTLSSMAS